MNRKGRVMNGAECHTQSVEHKEVAEWAPVVGTKRGIG